MIKELTIDAEIAARELFEAYCDPICRYLARLTGDPQRAEELGQEVFIRAYCALDKGTRLNNPRAWLYRVASRLAINEHRRQTLLKWVPLLPSDRDPAPDIESAVGERLLVRRALDELTPRYRVPLVLYSSEGYAVREVAQILGLSVGAVKTRLCRARARFRQVYEAQLQEHVERPANRRSTYREEHP